MMPARICTHRHDHAHICMHTWARTCYYVYILTSDIVPACACSMVGAITPMCVGTHNYVHARKHNAYVGAIMPIRAGTMIPSRACTHECNHSLMFYVPSIRFNGVIFVYMAFCAAAAAGMALGGPSGKHFLLFQTSVHHLLEYLVFLLFCPAHAAHSTTWWVQGLT